MNKILLSALWMTVFVCTAGAQWNGSPTAGTIVSSAAAANAKTGLVAVTDGAGGMFTAWIDARIGATPTVYIQRIAANGTLKFGNDVVVSNAAGVMSSAKTNLYMISDGAGGAVCVWQDSRNFSTFFPNNNDVYGQRIAADGSVLWTANGARLSVSDNNVSNKTLPAIALVNATEAVVVFGDTRNASVDLFAQKVLLSTGGPQWGADVSIHGDLTGTQNQQQIAADGSGGIYAVWQDPRNGSSTADVYATRINNGGSVATGWGANGNVVANGNNIQSLPQLVSLGAAGFVVTWADNRTGAGLTDVYAQRFDASGTPLWTSSPAGGSGVLVADNTTAVQTNPYIIAGGSGYSIIVWSDQRNGTSNRDVYAQRLDNGTGAAQWTQYGVQLTAASGNQPSSSTQSGIAVASDGSAGAIVVWDDDRASTSDRDIYAQRISSAGSIMWAANGVAVSTASGSNQQSPVAVQGVGGTALAAWQDSRSGAANSGIYAARLQANGVLPVHPLALNATAKSNAIEIKWNTVDELNTALFLVEKSNDGSSFRTVGAVKPAGTGSGAYAWEDAYPVRGLNYYRIQSVDLSKAVTYSSVAAAHYGAAVEANLTVFPNPVTQTATVQVTNAENGSYQLLLTDLSGRIVFRRSIAVTAGCAQVRVSLGGLAAGSYFLQLGRTKGAILRLPVQKQ